MFDFPVTQEAAAVDMLLPCLCIALRGHIKWLNHLPFSESNLESGEVYYIYLKCKNNNSNWRIVDWLFLKLLSLLRKALLITVSTFSGVVLVFYSCNNCLQEFLDFFSILSVYILPSVLTSLSLSLLITAFHVYFISSNQQLERFTLSYS